MTSTTIFPVETMSPASSPLNQSEGNLMSDEVLKSCTK